MEKRGSQFLGKVLLVILFFVLVNAGFIFYINQGNISFDKGFTGLSIREIVKDNFVGLNLMQKIVLFAQGFIFVLIILFIFTKELGKRGKKREITKEDIKIHSKKYTTDLDVLSDILKKKKKIHLSSISKTFNVSKETAMEWCRALEFSKIGSLEYPTLGEPYIKVQNG